MSGLLFEVLLVFLFVLRVFVLVARTARATGSNDGFLLGLILSGRFWLSLYWRRFWLGIVAIVAGVVLGERIVPGARSCRVRQHLQISEEILIDFSVGHCGRRVVITATSN